MAIHVRTQDRVLSRQSNIHSLPFKILADCDAKVSQYFKPSIKIEEDETLRASFRGYPLKGAKLDLPQGYVGVVLHESISPMCEKEERSFHIIHNFNSITYWNWDKIPSKNDKIVEAVGWICIAEALHNPILEE